MIKYINPTLLVALGFVLILFLSVNQVDSTVFRFVIGMSAFANIIVGSHTFKELLQTSTDAVSLQPKKQTHR